MPQNSPRLFVYAIIERKEGTKPYWMRVGTAFQNRDGSINIYLDLPVGVMKLQLREPPQGEATAEDAEGAGAEGAEPNR